MSELSWLLETAVKQSGFLAIALVFIYLWWRSDKERIKSQEQQIADQKENSKELKEVLDKYQADANKTASALASAAASQTAAYQLLLSKKVV